MQCRNSNFSAISQTSRCVLQGSVMSIDKGALFPQLDTETAKLLSAKAETSADLVVEGGVF